MANTRQLHVCHSCMTENDVPMNCRPAAMLNMEHCDICKHNYVSVYCVTDEAMERIMEHDINLRPTDYKS